MQLTAKYPIGFKFIPIGKAKHVHTVIDILKTYNTAGELVKIRYVSVHDFLGQKIINSDMPETAIARPEHVND